MPSLAVIRRTKPSLDAAAAAAPLLFEEPPATGEFRPMLSWVDAAARPVLRVGDYEVGETPCPRLCGHPGIRY